MKKLTKKQKSGLSSHNNKIISQETTLDIAELSKKFNKIYFPVKLGRKGILSTKIVKLNSPFLASNNIIVGFLFLYKH